MTVLSKQEIDSIDRSSPEGMKLYKKEYAKWYRTTPKGKAYYNRTKEIKKQRYNQDEQYKELLKSRVQDHYEENKNNESFKLKQKEVQRKYYKKLRSDPVRLEAFREYDRNRAYTRFKKLGGAVGPNGSVLRKTVPTDLVEIKRALDFGYRLGNDSEQDKLINAIGPFEDNEAIYELICDGSDNPEVVKYLEDLFSL